MSRVAVVLFNLGGPDGPEAVRPFLYNLFKDPAIISVPALLRYPIAALISSRRETSAQANYNIMGGASPLLPETRKQAAALEAALAGPGVTAKCFIAMRYWKPFADQTAKEVADFAPDEIVLLPLYPQFSTTTPASSVQDWAKAYSGLGRTRTVCCYPTADGLIAAHAEAIRKTWIAAGRPANVRLLFSAHGLPEKVIKGGDPYQAQVAATAAAVAALLPELPDWRVCYQSRVGPMKWIGPSTVEEIHVAGEQGVGLLLSPIAFVSEHIETLVELDHEYAELAEHQGVAPYLRAPALGVDQAFIKALAQTVTHALARTGGAAPEGAWLCPAGYGKCGRSRSVTA